MTRVRRRHVAAPVALLAAFALVSGCTGESPGDGKQATAPHEPQAPKPDLFSPDYVGVGVKKGQPGLSQKPKGNEFRGFEQMLLERLEEDLGFDGYPFDIPSDMREKLLQSEVVKLVIASYSITPTRQGKVLFTAPYLQTDQGVLVPDQEKSIKKWTDLAKHDVCTGKGSVSDPETVQDERQRTRLKRQIGAQSITPTADFKTCVNEVINGNYDAVVTDKLLLYGFEEYSRATKPKDEQVKVIDQIKLRTPEKQYYGIGLPKGHEKECRRINRKLRKLLFPGAEWNDMFRSSFRALAEKQPDFSTEYRPSKETFKSREKSSCRIK